MQVTKIELSSAELEVLTEREFFLMKRSVTDKLDRQFSALQEEWKSTVRNWKLPVEGIDLERGKIFRGENYRGFPYVIMDYPKFFGRDNVFAVRTMCWWGHEFSMTLHLQGRSLEPYRTDIAERLRHFDPEATYFCVNDTPWEYGFDATNYQKLSKLTGKQLENQLEKNGFVKLSGRLALGEWNRLPEFTRDLLERIGRFLNG